MQLGLGDLKSEKIFYYFEQISKIPRGSGNEKAVSDYMVQFAKDNNLEVKQDEANNIYIKKPATSGYENAEAIILQGHLDMVCEKTDETVHDFKKDSLALYVDGDFIHAKGTTLGADDGVALAYQLAILSDNTLEHPAIEVLMTTEEETGMYGAELIHPEYLEGKRLINIDTDKEGEFLISCAGGAKAELRLPIGYTESNKNNICYKIDIKGLLGGHSGVEINKERANANILMVRLLDSLYTKYAIQIATFDGGTKDNVITREASVVVELNKKHIENFKKTINEWQTNFSHEYAVQDPNIAIVYEEIEINQVVLTDNSTGCVIDYMMSLPQGIIAQSKEIEGLVETSLNIGAVSICDNQLKIDISVRSSILTKKEWIIRRLVAISKGFGAKCVVKAAYPEWEYSKNSYLRDKAVEIFEQMYNKKPEMSAVHAGLECGYIAEKKPGIDMISIGPNTYDIHTPEERVSISSMRRVYWYIVNLIKSMK
ncbi:MAG: aminoacyl-histidine dipeptidase [Cellulosilyticaceae bacterium]